MKLINGSRGSGKTESLIRYAYKNNCVILTYSQRAAKNIREKAIGMNLNILEPMAFKEYFDDELFKRKELSYKRGQFPVVVDELDLCLTSFFGEKIDCATGTIPVIHPGDYMTYEIFGNRNRFSEEDYSVYMGMWR